MAEDTEGAGEGLGVGALLFVLSFPSHFSLAQY